MKPLLLAILATLHVSAPWPPLQEPARKDSAPTAPEAPSQAIDTQISGVVVDVVGAPVPNRRVELQRLRGTRSLRPVTTTDAAGAFVFERLEPGRYEVLLMDEQRTLARSAAIELSVSAPSAMGVVVRIPPHWSHSTRRVSELPRTDAGRLRGATGVASSFAELQNELKPGHQVVFALRGRSRLAGAFSRGGLYSGEEALVADVSANRIVLLRRRWFRWQEIVLTEDRVSRVDTMDSSKQGGIIGTVVGGILGVALILETRDEIRSRPDCNLCPVGYVTGGALPVLGGILGSGIDRVITEPVYERHQSGPRVVLAPSLGSRRVGIVGQLSF